MADTLYLISGPSGSGKTALTQALVQRIPNLRKLTTYTTRPPRTGEVDGVDYHFVSLTTFQEMEHAGAFLETDVVYSEHYGLPLDVLSGDDVDRIVVITAAGAQAARMILCNTFGIFVLPPTPEVAAARVAARTAPNEAVRIASIAAEAEAAPEYDAVFVNANFQQTVEEITTRIAEHRRSLTDSSTYPQATDPFERSQAMQLGKTYVCGEDPMYIDCNNLPALPPGPPARVLSEHESNVLHAQLEAQAAYQFEAARQNQLRRMVRRMVWLYS